MPRKGDDADSRRAQGDTRTSEPQNPQGRSEQAPRQDRQAANAPPADRGSARRSGLGELFASAALRWGLGIAGFVLFLFALGQAVGLNLLGMLADALSTQTGRWLLVAVFALFLIGVARRGIVRTFRA